MSLLSAPEGAAREYSPLALTIYTDGCDHACRYCYCRELARRYGKTWGTTPQPRHLAGLEREAARRAEQILLSFVGDPYNAAEATHRNTRKALVILADAHCSVAVLTKGGTRCLEDLDLFTSWPGGRVKVGATLTFRSARKSREEEPGAPLPADRLEALAELHRAGVRTWASIEPVLEAAESLAAIKASLAHVDEYAVGKLNHQESQEDLAAFARQAVELIRGAGRGLYVKAALRPYLPVGYLTPAERDPDALVVSPRPAEAELALF